MSFRPSNYCIADQTIRKVFAQSLFTIEERTNDKQSVRYLFCMYLIWPLSSLVVCLHLLSDLRSKTGSAYLGYLLC